MKSHRRKLDSIPQEEPPRSFSIWRDIQVSAGGIGCDMKQIYYQVDPPSPWNHQLASRKTAVRRGTSGVKLESVRQLRSCVWSAPNSRNVDFARARLRDAPSPFMWEGYKVEWSGGVLACYLMSREYKAKKHATPPTHMLRSSTQS
jgi:hypothetical protein